MSTLLNFSFVGIPFRSDTDQQRASQFQLLQSQLGPSLGPVLRNVMLPQLKVGTLDSLVEASDDLARLDPTLESTVFRLGALIEDISGCSRAQATMLHLSSQSQKVSAEYYLKDFESFGWNTTQYDTKDGVPALIQKFGQVLAQSEERCRTLLSEFNEKRSKLTAIQRRTQGNLTSVPIKELVDRWCRAQGLKDGPVSTEFLTTLFVAVPLQEVDLWQRSYAKFHDFVVPRSSQLVAKDNEMALYSVICFKKVVDDVKTKSRQLRFSVRDVSNADDMTPEAVLQLKESVAHDRDRLSQLLSQQYTQCFVAWVHLKCVRLFVESVLKFGVPVRFVPALIAAQPEREAEVLSALEKLYLSYAPLQSFMSKGGVQDEADEEHQANNAKLASMLGENSSLQSDGAFVVLKCNNVLKGR